MVRNAFIRALLLLSCSIALANETGVVSEVRELRLRGELEQAHLLAEQAVAAPISATQTRFDLHLELARIHDRFGLHNDSRPVVAALQQVVLAAELVPTLGKHAAARSELAFADYYYRAEMQDREFEEAEGYAQRAIAMFDQLDDAHHQAEAVHRLGLIHLQRRELDRARELFEQSLQLDREGGERAFFRGEYERHVGFVYSLREQYEQALPYFERSLKYRLEAGAIDASLFAAISLAATLAELGRSEDARPHLDYAFQIADQIGSPAGRRRAEAVLARITQE